MRILTGALRGRKIFFKPNPFLRPTADKVRKAVFDTLQGRIRGARVLDLFSGTGAMGLEAISLEAAQVTFIEKDMNQAAAIKKNLSNLGLEMQGRVICADAIRAAQKFSEQGETYDIIFIDPPYGESLAAKTLEALAACGVTHPDSLLVAECAGNEPLEDRIGDFKKIKSRIYGGTRVSFFEHG